MRKVIALLIILTTILSLAPLCDAKEEEVPDFAIWLPDDYSPDVKYDVVMMLHGGKGNKEEMIDGDNFGFRMCDAYASIEGRPFIVVAIGNLTDRKLLSKRIIATFSYVADHYSTYAFSGNDVDLIAARDHFTVAGLSAGAYSAMYFMEHHSEYAANYIMLSITFFDCKKVPDDLGFVYFGAGTNEKDFLEQARRGYDTVKPVAARTYFSVMDRGGHNWRTWDFLFRDSLELEFGLKGDD